VNYDAEAAWHQVCAAVDARRRASYRTLDDPESATWFHMYEVLVSVNKDEHEIDKAAAMLRAIGVEGIQSRLDITPDLVLSNAERRFAADYACALRAQHAGAILLALCPGARFVQKDWGIERFGDLLAGLAREFAVTAVVLGGREDRALFVRLKERTGAIKGLCLIDAVGGLTPRQAAAVIGECDACVGNDTFGLHAAVAAGTPSVVIMGGGDFGRWAPWRNPEEHRMIDLAMDCFGCGWACRFGDFRCVKGIGVEIVLAEIRAILSRGKFFFGTKREDRSCV
jgi:ADP-heptose:LPS heptosyltransferase